MWMRHVTYINGSCSTYECVMLHILMAHVPHMNESCPTYEWVTLHIWMSHVPHMNVLCHTYGWVMSHIWMSHVTHINESCHTYECVMSQIYVRRARVPHTNQSYLTHDRRTRSNCVVYHCKGHVTEGHVTHTNVSCHTCECVMFPVWMRHGTHMNESCLTQNRTTHSICAGPHLVWRTLPLHMWDMSHSYVGHDVTICVTCLIICASSSVACHTYDEACHTYSYVMSHVWMWHVPHVKW